MEAEARHDQVMVLDDGRELGFAEWGDADGQVILDFHGGPGCRLTPAADPSGLVGSGLRWITTDRPGLGLSWPCGDRTVADFVEDIRGLLGSLSIEKVVAVGWSMGGAYAAACAALLPEIVTGLVLVAPIPLSVIESDGAERMGKSFAWILARDDPWRMAQIYTALGLEARRNPDLAVRLFSDGLSQSELAAFADAQISREFIAGIVEATRQGAIGLVDDLRVEMRGWGFDPGTIPCQTVLWQGDDDSFVCPADAKGWAETVPGITLRMEPGEGHLLALTRTSEFLGLIRCVSS
jgi:pimeloyl-ACP methyl ester carboxylesterase